MQKNNKIPRGAGMGEASSAEAFEEIRLDLYRLAEWLMGRERKAHTLQPTALLSEVWIKVFAGNASIEGVDRSQLIARAVIAMRRILTDHARRRAAEKRGGDLVREPLDDVLDRCAAQGVDALELEDALEKLGQVHPRPALAITLRFIAGFQVDEIAAQLGVVPQTVRNDLKLARAWLRRELGGGA